MDEIRWLITREIPRLRRYALALARDRDAADDLVQETLERAIRKSHLWTRQGSVRGWLYRMLYRVFLNQATRRRRRPSEVTLDHAEEIGEAARQEDRMMCRDIALAMQRLPVEQRAAIALTAIEGLSYDEAAAVMEIPIGTLRSRISRGRDALHAMVLVDDAPPVRTARRSAAEPLLRRVK